MISCEIVSAVRTILDPPKFLHPLPNHTSLTKRYTGFHHYNFLRWLDGVFHGQFLSSLNINYVSISKDLEK